MLLATLEGSARAQFVLHRNEATVVVEPYAANIVHVSLSLREQDAVAPAGYGVLAHPVADGWTQRQGVDGDHFRSQALDIQRLTLKCMYGAGVASKFMNANRRYNGSDRSGKSQYLFMENME